MQQMLYKVLMVRYPEGSDVIYSLLITSLTLHLQETELTAQTYGLLIRHSHNSPRELSSVGMDNA